MKTAEEVLDALGRLAAADRAWILQALSERAKARLRQVAAAHEGRSPEAHGHHSGPHMPEDLVQRAPWLADEPAWTLAAVLGVRHSPWQTRLLAKLSPEKRREVMQLRAGLPPLSKKMEEALGRALSEQISAAAQAPRASFEDAVERERGGMWRRSRGVAEVGT